MRRPATLAPLAVLGVLGALVSGCTAPTPSTAPTTPTPSSAPSSALEAELESAVQTVDGFWRDQWPTYFAGSYTSPAVVGLYDGTTDAATCDGRALSAGNAFYCPEEDFLAWDLGLLTSGADIGPAWPYFVVAHEWGHAIQARIDPALVAEQTELQADCFAGAALADTVAAGAITEDDLAGIAALLKVSGRGWDGTNHVDAPVRLAIFDRGRQLGVAGCLAAELEPNG